MFEFVVVVATALVLYLWLTCTVSPLLRGVRTTCRSFTGRGWRAGVLYGAAIAASATVVTLSALLLMAAAAPHVAVEVIDGPALPFGARLGAALWFARITAAGLSRMGPRLELEVALALASIVSADRAGVARVKQTYVEHMLGGRPSRVEPVAGSDAELSSLSYSVVSGR